MKSLTIKKLEADKGKLEGLIKQAQEQVGQWNAKLLQFDGALAYVNENIKELKEVGDDRKRADNKSQSPDINI